MSRKWTFQELQMLKELYPDTPVEVIAEKLNRGIEAIYRKAKQESIERSVEWKSKMQQMFKENLIKHGEKSRFRKGDVPFTKGKKIADYMSSSGLEKFKKTHFKKGSIPHNTKPLFSERLRGDGYIEIKVRESGKNYEMKHRWLWKCYYGKIPNGYNVEFKDGDKTNVSIDNLVLRTRKENIINNTLLNEVSVAKRFFKVKSKEEYNYIKSNFPELLNAQILKNKINLIIKNNE